MFLYREVAALFRLRPTLRTQLTLLYGGLLAALGGGLLVVLVPLRGTASVQAGPHAAAVAAALNAAIRDKEIIGAIAVPVVVLLAIVGGWLIAGRLLRPLRTITATARDISASNLDRRLSLAGPDEFAELGETLDDLFGRLEASFDAQRHFVANASHELRTPLTAERALLQVALGDPAATAQTLRAACEQVLALGDQQERLIEALLALATSEGGIERWEPFDLAAVAWHVVAVRREEAGRRGVDLETSLGAAPTAGDPRLAESLVANLVDNAIQHNTPEGGRAEISTSAAAGQAALRVRNTGPVVAPERLGRLFQPFGRAGGERIRHSGGHGLGLAIVQAIARAHGAALTPRAQPEGGLDIEVTFPAKPAGAPAHPPA